MGALTSLGMIGRLLKNGMYVRREVVVVSVVRLMRLSRCRQPEMSDSAGRRCASSTVEGMMYQGVTIRNYKKGRTPSTRLRRVTKERRKEIKR